MAREFRLPDIGEGLTEAEIVQWLVAEGERVEADQPVVEVETDKAVVEIPSPYGGIVLSHGGAEGDVIEVGAVLLVVGEEHEGAPQPPESVQPDPPAPQFRPIPREVPQTPEPVSPLQSLAQEVAPAEPQPIVGTLSEDAEVLTPPDSTAAPVPAAVRALPIVRKLARDNDVDLESIEGSGPDGRITREDVEAAIATRTEPIPEPSKVEVDVPAERPQAGRQKMSRLRRTIAANMSKSWSEIPHVTTFDDVDATRLLEVRSALAERHGAKIPIEALVIKGVVPALDAFPEFNASIEGDDLIVHESHDVGIAVDTPEGLMVAVIRDASSKTILELASEIRVLGEGARGRTLTPDQLTGQTFTISNIGAVGGGHGTPIVPYGTTAILSVGLARTKPIVYDDDLVIAPVMPLSLSYDHRVVDGAQGRRFMALVMENLEEPALFLA